MNRTETAVIEAVIDRLGADNDRCSRQVLEALNDPNLRIYLDTWVLSALRLLVKEGRSMGDLHVARDLVS